MNVLYCGDEHIEDGLIISILSLLKNVKQELHIYVLTISLNLGEKQNKGISDLSIQILDERVKKQNSNNFVKKIDITELFNKNIPIQNMETRFTPFCMLRLFSDLLPELPEKLLYLDTDVICRKDCIEFYNQDITNYELVGVLDYYGKYLNSNKSNFNFGRIKIGKNRYTINAA